MRTDATSQPATPFPTPPNWRTAPHRTDDSSLLTVKQVAKRLNCSEANVYWLLENGELPYVPVGKRKAYRFDPADVEAFIQERKIQRHKPARRPSRPKLKHIKLK